jgi:cobalt/nickel transport system permease protein
VTTVLVIQCLVLADGALTALGLNITNMAMLGTAAGYLIIVVLLRVLPRTPLGLGLTTFVASVFSVMAASQGFVLEYWLGGTTSMSIPTIAAAMAGSHLLIGIGEGVIAAITVVTVAKVRPDLVYGLRARRARGQNQPATPATAGV